MRFVYDDCVTALGEVSLGDLLQHERERLKGDGDDLRTPGEGVSKFGRLRTALTLYCHDRSWDVLELLNGRSKLLIEHTPYRRPTEGELRWQVSQSLAYGAHTLSSNLGWTTTPIMMLSLAAAVG